MNDNEKKHFNNKNKIAVFSILAVLIILLTVLGGSIVVRRVSGSVSQGELARRLEADGSDTIAVKGTVKVKKPLVINGDKTIVGDGEIVLVKELEGDWPGVIKNNSWGKGCSSLELEKTDGMPAMFNVGKDATLSFGGAVTLNASGLGNAIQVEDEGTLVVKDKAVVQQGRYANVIISDKGTADLQGGSIKDSERYGIINYGTLDINDGEHSGSEAVVYNLGKTTQSGGKLSESSSHNVYVASGTFTMTGGVNDGATKDAVIVQEGAKAIIEEGEIKNCVHGLCNKGEINAGSVILNECGIMNYNTGDLKINGTTVDTAATYCLANNGGKVTANKFTAKRCDTCAIYNFSGDMDLTDLTITGSRDGNIGNGGGNLTVNGAKLEKCRDKSITIAKGKAVFNDVILTGTSNVKFGVYVYGGELFMTKGKLSDISSSAFKVDAGGYVELNEITLKDIAENAFYTDGGKIFAKNVVAEGIGSHAVYNKAGDLTVSDATIKAIKKNVIQQKGGTTTLKKVKAEEIGNNGAYVELGSVIVEESTFKNMNGNGFYIVKGENDTTIKKLVLEEVGKQGINNSSKTNIDGLTIKKATQNGIFNKEAGVLVAKNVVITDVEEHGINNYNTMTLENADISDSGKKSNGLQNRGTLTIKGVTVKNSKNHGAYNVGTIKGSDLTIKDVAQNGVYNAKGKFEVSKINVAGTGQHGLNNVEKMIITNVNIDDTGKNKNSIQNTGILSIVKATLQNSKNHGIYNDGTVSGQDVTALNVGQNGIYNAKNGNVDAINGFTVDGAGSHGVNNEGKLEISDVIVSNIKRNGIYNHSGNATLNKVKVSNVAEHGVNNVGTMVLMNAEISALGSGKNGIQNVGTITTNSVAVNKSQNHGIYNNGTFKSMGALKISNAASNGIYNDKGTMTVDSATITNSGKHGIYNENVFHGEKISVTNAKDIALSNKGEMEIHGLKTTGEANKAIYNSGTAKLYDAVIDGTNVNNVVDSEAQYLVDAHGGILELADSTLKSAKKTAIFMREAATVNAKNIVVDKTGDTAIFVEDTTSFIGEKLEIKDVANGCAIYNKGKANIKNLVVTNPKDGIVSRYNGWTILSGTIKIANAERNPISTYGTENGNYNNGIEMASGSILNIEGCNYHAINNKGSFLAAEDTSIIIRDVVGSNVNAINNNKGTMKLGNVTVDNVQATISLYDSEKLNVNAGNAIFTNSSLQLDGDAVISNIYTLPENNKSENLNGSGVVNSGGSITGKGSIKVEGNGAKEINAQTYQGVFNGVYTKEGTIDIQGDITVSMVKNQGVCVADSNAKLTAKDITISDVSSGNGIYINHTSGILNASGTITINNTNQRGIANTQGGDIVATGIVVSNTKDDGVNNGTGGTMNVSGNIQITNAGNYGISMGGSTQLIVKGVVTVDMKSAGKYGIYNQGGTINIASLNVKNTKDNGIHMENQASLQSNTVNVANTAGQAIQLNHDNILNVTTMEITNSSKNGLRLYNNNANPSVTIGKLIARDCAERAIAAQKQITDENISISEVWYKNCASGVVHGNVKSGVATPQELTN